jgi:GDPmannose 4,6-dehydratase
MILQQKQPDDYVLATGVKTSVRQFVERSFAHTGVSIGWKGTGAAEQGFDAKTGRVLVEIDARYFRPTEVDLLQGDASKAREKLGWEPKITVDQMIKEMVDEDLKALKSQPNVNKSHD